MPLPSAQSRRAPGLQAQALEAGNHPLPQAREKRPGSRRSRFKPDHGSGIMSPQPEPQRSTPSLKSRLASTPATPSRTRHVPPSLRRENGNGVAGPAGWPTFAGSVPGQVRRCSIAVGLACGSSSRRIPRARCPAGNGMLPPRLRPSEDPPVSSSRPSTVVLLRSARRRRSFFRRLLPVLLRRTAIDPLR